MAEKITREQLEAMGLSEEEIAAIMEEEEATNGSGSLPFPIAKICYSPEAGAKLGDIVIGPHKDEEGFVTGYDEVIDGSEYTFRILASYGQYSKFDATTNRPVITSDLLKGAKIKQARDLKTGKLISELRKHDDQIKYANVALVEFKAGDKSVVAIFYIKGKWLFDFNDALKKKDVTPSAKVWITASNKRQKKGAITFFTCEVKDIKQVGNDEYIKELKQIASYLTPFKNWAESVNSALVTSQDNTNKSDSSVDETEADIQWD